MKTKINFWQTIKRVVAYAKPHRIYFYLACLFDLIAVASNMFMPVVLSWGIDKIVGVGQVDFPALQKILIVIVILTIISSIFEWFAVYFENILSNRTSESIRNLCFNKINNVPLKYIDNTAHGDIMNTMINDVDNVASGFLSGFRTILSGIATIVSCSLFMIYLNWQLAIVVIVLAPISVLLSTYITKRAKKLYHQEVNVTGKISAYTEEMISNLKIVKAYNNEKINVKNFGEINDELRVCSEKAAFFSSIASPGSRFINGTLYGIIGVVGAILGINGLISVGKISAFLEYVDNYTAPYANIADILADIQVAVASANRVFSLLDEKNVPSDRGKETLTNCDGKLELQNVYFSYTPQVKLIEDFNLSVKKGQHVAIVGPTGCGKSTLINLLMRFYDVNYGRIIISGKDSEEITRNSLRSCYGMVLQESWLYNASIRDNIAYGKPEATMEEVVEAGKLSGAHSFIEKLPDGYNTIINENADNVSAG